jgi:guanosine-3',5'-bis(diphosphate) 3'-pyrophosphohydrolase
VLTKLADRLHDTRPAKSPSEPHQQRIASETRAVHTLLAQRRDMGDIKWQLEDQAFKHLMPREYRLVSRLVSRKRSLREAYTRRAVILLKEALSDAGIDCTVHGRTKHLYSTYQKLQRFHARGRKFHEMCDLTGLRVIVESVAECYRVLGVVHQKWRPVCGEFDDYIANPKESLYQSLHTSVIGPEGYPLEVQIRTKEMHRIAEEGVAAHLSYKQREPNCQGSGFDQKLVWIPRRYADRFGDLAARPSDDGLKRPRRNRAARP